MAHFKRAHSLMISAVGDPLKNQLPTLEKAHKQLTGGYATLESLVTARRRKTRGSREPIDYYEPRKPESYYSSGSHGHGRFDYIQAEDHRQNVIRVEEMLLNYAKEHPKFRIGIRANDILQKVKGVKEAAHGSVMALAKYLYTIRSHATWLKYHRPSRTYGIFLDVDERRVEEAARKVSLGKERFSSLDIAVAMGIPEKEKLITPLLNSLAREWGYTHRPAYAGRHQVHMYYPRI